MANMPEKLDFHRRWANYLITDATQSTQVRWSFLFLEEGDWLNVPLVPTSMKSDLGSILSKNWKVEIQNLVFYAFRKIFFWSCHFLSEEIYREWRKVNFHLYIWKLAKVAFRFPRIDFKAYCWITFCWITVFDFKSSCKVMVSNHLIF